MSFEKAVQRIPRAESQQAAQFRKGEVAQPELLHRQCFQGAARQVSDGFEAVGKIIGNVEGYMHDGEFMGSCGTGQSQVAASVRMHLR